MKYNLLFVDRVRKGDLAAFQELYLDLFPRLSSFAYNFV
jgi:DNA-directed RNA polymerase specialized sigma24 family protein